MSKYAGEPKKEDMFTVVGVMLMSVTALALLVWFAARTKIVAFWAPKLYILSRMYLVLPGDIGTKIVSSMHDAGVDFLQRPNKVGVFDWIVYWNTATRPLVLIIVLALIVWLVRLMFKSRPEVQRQFSKKPQRLAEHLSHVFTGTAPVLHLRKAISQNKEKYWRRQLFPHELLLNEKINGKPLISDNQVNKDRLREYLMGLETEKKDGKVQMKLWVGAWSPAPWATR